MKRIKKPLIILVVVISLGMLVIKGLLWMAADKVAKKLQSSLPFGMLEYEGIETSLSGAAGVTNVTITTPGLGTPIKIAKVEVVAGNVIELLLLNYNYFSNKSNFPEKMSLRFVGVETSLSDFVRLDKFSYPLSAPCGSLKEIGPTELIQMGYHRVVADYEVSYQVNPSIDSLVISIDNNMHDLMNLKVTYTGALSQLPMYGSSNTFVMPEVEFHIKDLAFLKTVHGYCATQENMTDSDYLNEVRALYKASTKKEITASTGIELGDALVDALVEYSLNPGDLYFSLRPREAIDIVELEKMEPDVIVNRLNLVLKINGQDVPIEFKRLLASYKKRDGFYGSSYDFKGRRLVSINDLNKEARNKKISIYLVSGSNYVGMFRRVEDNKVYITLNKSGGASNFSLDVSMISKVFILPEYE